MNFNKFAKAVTCAIIALICGFVSSVSVLAAGYGITLSPMSQQVILIPGDSYETSFNISNPSGQTEDAYYKLSVEPFYVNENGAATFEAKGDSGKIVDWISFEVPEDGKLSPNNTSEIKFRIDVPENAAAGGQYASIIVTMMNEAEKRDDDNDKNGVKNSDDNKATIKEIKRIAHLVYAEVAGNTFRKGEISDVSLSSFLFSGNITASSLVKNTGNVHGSAYYKLQVFPLFSNEEIYSNEEHLESHVVLPDQTLHNETAWEDTPGIGIFNVVYTVEFEGSEARIERMVIKCPVWLLFIIIFVIAALIIWIAIRIRARKEKED